MIYSRKIYGFLILLMIAVASIQSPLYAQKVKAATVIVGTIKDDSNNEIIPFATVSFVGIAVGCRSDDEGQFELASFDATDKIKVACIGYETQVVHVDKGRRQTITIKMKTSTKAIDEVVVKPKKLRYKKRDNPSIDLINQVISHRDKNRKESLDYFEYEKYEKLMFGLSNITEEFKQRRSFRKFQFIFNNLDTTKISGKQVLPVYLKESLSDFYYRKSPKTTKEIVKAQKMVGFEGYIDNNGLNDYLKYLYQDIDIYENNILVLTNQFLSPIAGTATTFYKYFIIDTCFVGNAKCIKMFFSPYNKNDFLFQGYMYIMADSSYAVKKVDMYVNKNINLNWVKTLRVKQEFQNVDNHGWMLSHDEVDIDFGLSENSTGLYGQRAVTFQKYLLNMQKDDSIYNAPDIKLAKTADAKPDSFWVLSRHEPLEKSEVGIYATMDSVKKVPAFKRTMSILMLVLFGYKDLGYYEIGPVNSFYSYNPIEGFRGRLGGRTTPKFSKKINFETYAAYGFKDKKAKYYLGSTYSFTDKSIYEFPVKSLKICYQNETKIPGQDLQFIQEDNVLLSIKRGVNDKLFYNKTARIEYLNEFENHISISAMYQFNQQTPAGSLYFNRSDYSKYTNDVANINISELGLTLRYAPHEKFYQSKQFRVPLPSKYPVMQLQYTLGSKIIGNDYNYHMLKAMISRRFYLSVLGYTDVILEAGKLFGTVPYPLLMIHRANQTYSYQIMSYNLMNFLEFVSDEYISLNIDHCFNGFIFNKIPLFKKLKFREVAACKILYGSVSRENNPAYHSNLFKFPTEANGTPITYTLEKAPYIEASVGVSNIFKLFRVDLVKRLTYLDHQNVSSTGIRVRFKLDF